MPIEFNKKPGLVIYLTVGDPDLATTRDVALAAIDAGADVLELGVPFSDPLADGPVIQRASERAVANGTRLQDVLCSGRRTACHETLGRPGDLFLLQPSPALWAGALLCPGRHLRRGRRVDHRLIVEEAAEYLNHLHHNGLMPIFLAAPTSSDHRLKMIADVSDGFVYAISRVGITGAQQSLASDARRLVERLRRFTRLPIAVGFGISTAEHVAAVGEFADAAVIGSAIVALIEKSEPGKAPAAISTFLQGLRQVPVQR